MKRFGKKTLALLLALVLVFALSPLTAMPAKAGDGGDCGNCSWSLGGNTLTITCSAGNGEIPDYSSAAPPWASYSFTTVVIKDGVKTIGANAFAGNPSLQYVYIWEGVKSIGYRSFYSCRSLQYAEIPASVTTVGYEAFGGCDKLVIACPTGALSGTTGCIRYAWQNRIPDQAFSGCASLRYIQIPANVTVIGDAAFEGCTGLESVLLPQTVTTIGDDAFNSCGLETVFFSDSVGYIGKRAFSGCGKLEDLYYYGVTGIAPGNLNSINIWEGNDALKSAALHSVRLKSSGSCSTDGRLGWLLFSDGTLLHAGIGNMMDYGSGAAPWGTEIQRVLMDGSPANIGSYAFAGCSNLTDIRIPDGVITIGEGAFAGSGLVEISISPYLMGIRKNAFAGCAALKQVYIRGSSNDLNFSFDDGNDPFLCATFYYASGEYLCLGRCGTEDTANTGVQWNLRVLDQDKGQYALQFYGIAGSVMRAFSDSHDTPWYQYASQIVSVDVGYNNSLVNIGKNAFAGMSKLVSVRIPASVTAIGQNAFSGCTGLKEVNYGGTKAEWAKVQIASGNEALQSAKVYCADTLRLQDVSPDKNTAKTGETIVWNTLTTGGSGTLRYCFYVYKDGTVIQKGGYSETAYCLYTPTEAGVYAVKAFVKDGAGASVSAMSAGVTVTAGSPSVTKVTPSKTSADLGESITWTAEAIGGVWPLRYCFYIYKDGTVIQKSGYGTEKTISYTPTAAGTYSAEAFVKDSSGASGSLMGGSVTVAAAAPTILDLKVNRISAAVGETLTWTAAASGGTGTLRYCFYVYQGSTVVHNSGYGTAKTVSYTPTASGTYKAKVFVKDSAGKSSSRLSGNTTVTAAADPLNILGFAVESSTAVLGETLSWTALVTGGVSPLRYCFYIYKDGAVVQKTGYGTAKKASFTPTETGKYTVKVFVKDSAGNAASHLGGSITVTAGSSDPPTITDIAVYTGDLFNAAAHVGQAITWRAYVKDGAAPLKYCFYVYKDGAVVYSTGYGTEKVVSYTPTAAGNYKVKVFVKDSAGHSTSKMGGSITASADSAELNILGVAVEKSTASLGEEISWTALVMGGAAPVQCCFYVYKDGAVVHKTGYGSSKNVSYTPTAAGKYSVKVFLKDSAGAALTYTGGTITVS